MKLTHIMITVAMFLSLISLCAFAENSIKSQAEGAIIGLSVQHVGSERFHIKTQILYASSDGMQLGVGHFGFRISGVNQLEEQKCNLSTLEILFELASKKDQWFHAGDFGNTELRFYRSDRKVKVIYLEKRQMTELVTALKDVLLTNSILFQYTENINVISPTLPHLSKAQKAAVRSSEFVIVANTKNLNEDALKLTKLLEVLKGDMHYFPQLPMPLKFQHQTFPSDQNLVICLKRVAEEKGFIWQVTDKDSVFSATVDIIAATKREVELQRDGFPIDSGTD